MRLVTFIREIKYMFQNPLEGCEAVSEHLAAVFPLIPSLGPRKRDPESWEPLCVVLSFCPHMTPTGSAWTRRG